MSNLSKYLKIDVYPSILMITQLFNATTTIFLPHNVQCYPYVVHPLSSDIKQPLTLDIALYSCLSMYISVLLLVYFASAIEIPPQYSTRIPKILHYIWLGPHQKSEATNGLIANWRRIHPDWLIVEWNDETIPQLNMPFLDEAYRVGKFAFAADALRAFVMMRYGGVYLDTDVEIRKPLDCFMNHTFFIGRDNWTDGRLEPFLFGCVPNHIILQKLVHYYETTHFIKADGSFDETLIPLIMSKIVSELFHIDLVKNQHVPVTLQDNITFYPYWFFELPLDEHHELYARHLYFGSWREGNYEKNLKLTECYQQCRGKQLVIPQRSYRRDYVYYLSITVFIVFLIIFKTHRKIQ